jgi:hypothetical protein
LVSVMKWRFKGARSAPPVWWEWQV